MNSTTLKTPNSASIQLPQVLSTDALLAAPCDFDLGGTTVRYTRCPRSGIVEFSCFPTALKARLATQRELDSGPHIDGLPARWKPQYAHQPEWLVQFKLAGTPEPALHQAGRSLRGSSDLAGLSFRSLNARELSEGGMEIITTLAHVRGFQLCQVLRWQAGRPFFQIHTEFHNATAVPLTLEYLPSFSLGGLTPFHPGEASEQLRLHRFRSAWSGEGRHEARLLEELQLERSWSGASRRIERFGQAGSLPVREFFPWAAIEDTAVGVMWGVQLSAPGSWHLEAGRCKDKVTLSGGLPCRDFGEWWKIIGPGESFASPPGVLACVHGEVSDLCAALTAAQVEAADQQPAWDHSLPMIFNEWCSSWGEPTHDDIVATAQRLAQTRTRILVIDDGWAEKPAGQGIQFNGDWVVDTKKFPNGLKPACDAIRALGLIPGLWFELEAATKGTKAFALLDRHLRRDGKVVQVGSRHFWNLRDLLTQAYLAEKVITRLREDGFGYLKVDYNETLPGGVDGAESPGEGLRQHLQAVQQFLTHIRRELPDLLIENCSSGGHRLEPSFQALCAMGCFSDSHETISIPIIAANLHYLILPRQSQVWCVIHASDTRQRLRYGLAATLLGRMCLSGDLQELSSEQLAEIKQSQAFYESAAPVIRDGRSRIYRAMSASWNHPRGWQAVVRHTENKALLVAHTFGMETPATLEVPLPPGEWKLAVTYGDWPGLPGADTPLRGSLMLPRMPGFTGAAALLGKISN